jgi:hypothetical protein
MDRQSAEAQLDLTLIELQYAIADFFNRPSAEIGLNLRSDLDVLRGKLTMALFEVERQMQSLDN